VNCSLRLTLLNTINISGTMYKYVHTCDDIPVFVRDDVLPELLSLHHPFQSNLPNDYERTIEFEFSFEGLINLGLISEVPQNWPDNLPDPVQFVVSPCTTALIFHYYSAEEFSIESSKLAWYRDTSLHRFFFGENSFWCLRFYFRYLGITDENYLIKLRHLTLATQLPSFVC